MHQRSLQSISAIKVIVKSIVHIDDIHSRQRLPFLLDMKSTKLSEPQRNSHNEDNSLSTQQNDKTRSFITHLHSQFLCRRRSGRIRQSDRHRPRRARPHRRSLTDIPTGVRSDWRMHRLSAIRLRGNREVLEPFIHQLLHIIRVELIAEISLPIFNRIDFRRFQSGFIVPTVRAVGRVVLYLLQ